MICPYCGVENKDTAKYCNNCGLEINPDMDLVVDQKHEPFFSSGTTGITLNLADFDKMVSSSTVDAADIDPLRGVNPNGNTSLSEIPAISPLHNKRLSDSDIPNINDEVNPVSGDTYINDINDSNGVPYVSAEDAIRPLDALEPTQPIIGTLSVSDFDEDTPAQNSDTIDLAASRIGMESESQNAITQTPSTYSATSYVAVDGAKRPKRMSFSKKPAIIAVVLLALIALAAFATYNMQLWGGKSIPDVMGMSESEAVAILEDEGFAVKVEDAVSDGPADIIIGVSPAVGMRLEEGSLITLSRSIPRTIPDIIGMTEQEALDALAQSGYTEGVSVEQTKSNEAEGTVVSVSPGVGEVAVATSEIVVDVAVPFTVPSVEGLTRSEAVDALEGEGYVVETRLYNTSDVAEGMAVSTDPGAGEQLPSGSSVVLYIAHDRGAELVELTRQYFAGSKTYTINGTAYELSEVKAVSYAGGESCNYTIVARPFETHSWFGTETETRYGNYETINGTLTWDSDNDLVKTEPNLRRG